MNRNTVVDPSPRQLGERQRKSDFFSYTWTTYSLFVCLFWSLSSYSIIFHARTTRDYKKKRWILFQRFIRCPCMQVFFVLKTEKISTAFEISWFLIITWNYAWFRILRIDWRSASTLSIWIGDRGFYPIIFWYIPPSYFRQKEAVKFGFHIQIYFFLIHIRIFVMSNYENNLNSMNETKNRHSLNTCDWIDEKRSLKVKIVQFYSKRPHQHFRYPNARNLCF